MLRISKITLLKIFTCVFISILIFFIPACVPFERITKVSTEREAESTSNSCIVIGIIADVGEGGIEQHGHCWSTNPAPAINGNKTEKGSRTSIGRYESGLEGLAPDTKYYVRAYAIDDQGIIYGNEITFTTLPVPIPGVPSNLHAEPVSPSQINLSWEYSGPDIEGFKIERSPNGITDWIEIATVEPDKRLFENKELSPATTYYYRVRSFNAGINSSFTEPVQARTFDDIPKPATPINPGADPASSTRITINWTDNSDNEEGFIIERSEDGTTGWMPIDTIVSIMVVVYNFTDTSLLPSHTYYYRVAAYNAGGKSAYTDVVSAKTFSDILPPAAPENLTAVAVSKSQINLTWSYSGQNPEGFKIERSPNEPTNWESIDTVGAEVRSYEDNLLSPSTTYYYRVMAFNAGINSDYTDVVSAKTFSDILSPAAPQNLTADAISSSQIYLEWMDMSNNEEGFKIERAGASMTWREIDSVGADITNYLNEGLTASITYYYRVRAYNAGGTSDYSDTVSAKTKSDIPVPAAPSELQAVAISDSRIDLSWINNAAFGEADGLQLERSRDGIYWSEIAAMEPEITNFQDTLGLSPSTFYYYRIRAFNGGGPSDWSDSTYTETFRCPGYLLIDYIEGDVTPVTETNIRYVVVETNLTGENKCWIKQNLGAHQVAGGPADDTENTAGWYWQFNRKQGYKHDGFTRTPGTTWIYPIDESSEWQLANDPCNILFGGTWRIPTHMEWQNADNNGGWNNYNDAYASDLNLHAAGTLEFTTGELFGRGSSGLYWTTHQSNNLRSWLFLIEPTYSMTEVTYKTQGLSIRCIKD